MRIFTVLTVFIIVLYSFSLQAQSISSYQIATYGSGIGDDDEVNSLAVLSNGNRVVGGNFKGLTNFNTENQGEFLIPSGSTDGYIACYSPTNQLAWKVAIGGISTQTVQALAADSFGNVYAGGYFIDEVVVGGVLCATEPSGNSAQAYIVKLNQNGQLLWCRSFGGNAVDDLADLVCDASGNVYFTGAFSATAYFNPSDSTQILVATGTQDAYVAKIDSGGNCQWAFSLPGTSSFGIGKSIDFDAANQLLVAGHFLGSIDVDPSTAVQSLISAGNYDLFVANYTTSGNLIQAFSTGGTAEDMVEGVGWGTNQSIFLCGSFQFTTDLSPGSATTTYTSAGNKDAFLAKYSTSGQLQFARQFGSSSAEIAFDLALNQSKSVCAIVGYFANTINFNAAGSASLVAQSTDAFICVLDSSGNYSWAQRIGGSGFDAAYTVTVANNEVIVGGSFVSTVDFDPGTAVENYTTRGTAYNSSFYSVYQQSTGNYVSTKVTFDPLGGNDTFSAIARDQQDNLVALGTFEGTVKFGSDSLISAGAVDLFVLGLDSAGNHQFAFPLGNAGSEVAGTVVTDLNNNFIVVGTFSGVLDVDPSSSISNISSNGNVDIFVAKYTQQGSLLWAKNFGGSSTDFGTEAATDSLGNIYVTGNFRTTVVFDTAAGNTLTAAVRDVFLLKLDASGNVVWVQKAGGTSNDYGQTVVVAPNQSVYLGGEFSGNLAFSNSAQTFAGFGGTDVFVANYSPTGGLNWGNVFGGAGNESIRGLAILPNGHLVAGGGFSLNMVLGTDTFISNGNTDAYLLLFDSLGTYQRGTNWGVAAAELVQDVIVTTSGQIAALSNTGSALLNPLDTAAISLLTTHANSVDVVLTTHSDSLNLVSFFAIGGEGTDAGAELIESQGEFVVAGDFSGTLESSYFANFQSIVSNGGKDAFLLRTTLVPACEIRDTITVQFCVDTTLLGQYINQSGYYAISFNTLASCDSIVTIDAQKLSSATTIQLASCDSFYWDAQSIWLKNSGLYSATLSNQFGCDSTVNLQLTIHPSDTTNFSHTACNSYVWNGITYTASGLYSATFTNHFGCDSTVNLQLTIHPSDTNNFSQTACNSYVWNGTIYTTSGLYSATFTNQFGCDSTVNLQLTIHPSDTTNFSQTACNSYVWNGTIYTASGLYSATFANQFGCDSIVNLQLTIHPSDTTNFSQTACNSYVWNGTTYSASGLYTATFTNQFGCDSTVNLQLTIHPSDTNNFSQTACNSYVWNGTIYTASGLYSATFTNHFGCDSTVNLQLTIHPSGTTILSQSACQSYTWNGTTYTASGLYSATFTNQFGCDSTVNLQLTLEDIDAVIYQSNDTLISFPIQGASYLWFQCGGDTLQPIVGATMHYFVPTATGNYAVEISTAFCNDTSTCFAYTHSSVQNVTKTFFSSYPNPSIGEVFLNFDASLNGSVLRIYNNLGQLIKEQQIEPTVFFDQPGIYYIVVKNYSQRLLILPY